MMLLYDGSSLTNRSNPNPNANPNANPTPYPNGMSLDPRIGGVNLSVSFSTWAELIWRYLLEVTNTVNSC